MSSLQQNNKEQERFKEFPDNIIYLTQRSDHGNLKTNNCRRPTSNPCYILFPVNGTAEELETTTDDKRRFSS
eukprot:jgi/Psemu1/1724/gm1.1724_g